MKPPSIHASPQEAHRHREYDRWFRNGVPGASLVRWLMSGLGQWFTNGPALRLPIALRLDARARVLDVGCGRGTLLRTFDRQLHPSTAPVGIDWSRAAIELAVRDGGTGDRPRFVLGSGTRLPFLDGAFTLVTCGYVARHLDDHGLHALFTEIHRVLAPGGLAVVWEFGPSGHAGLDAWNARVLAPGVRHPRLRSSATLRRIATAAGFTFAQNANLRPFLLPPIARSSVLLGRPPEGWSEPSAG